jgi:transposase
MSSAADVLAEARAHVESGTAWKARDLLAAHVETTDDAEALTLLGHVLHGMGDLPRAGAMWFAAGAKGPEADAAVAAWREQCGDDFAVMWRSLPAPVREEPRAARIEALHAKALDSDARLDEAPEPFVRPGELVATPEEEGGGVDAAQVIGWILAALFVVAAVIGVVTVLGWLMPGA